MLRSWFISSFFYMQGIQFPEMFTCSQVGPALYRISTRRLPLLVRVARQVLFSLRSFSYAHFCNKKMRIR